MRRKPRTPVSPQAGQPDQTPRLEDAGRRWRPVLERRWDRKVDEVIALTAACEELPAGTATAPYRQLHARAAVAHDELGALVDALTRIDDGTYGRCEGCARPIADDWLAHDPAIRLCPDCMTAQVSSASPGTGGRSHYGFA